MRILESIVLIAAITGGISWTIISNKDGYKQNNAMIVARAIDVSATIDGDVENEQLAVGTSLQTDDLMVKIRNTRVDQSRVTELKTKVSYLKREIKSAEYEKVKIDYILADLKKKSQSYKNWLVKNLQLKKDVKMRERIVAEKQKLLKTQKLRQTQGLYKKRIISVVELQAAQTETAIADTQLKVIKAELARIQFSLKSVQNDQIFFENGNASYWQKTIDTLMLKVFDSESKADELQAQLKQFSEQEKVELSQLGSNFTEEHRAPFPGVVNAVYVAKGAHIKSGTVLMQVLDCSNPVVIVPIPEARFSDFTIGKKVTINPIDSTQSLSGTIKYISSGPLISQDKTIALQQELTAKGNHAVISFDSKQFKDDLSSTCDTTRRAVVTIKTHSLYDKINEWVNLYLGKAEIKLASLSQP